MGAVKLYKVRVLIVFIGVAAFPFTAKNAAKDWRALQFY
jgi:hypothetical protein